MEMMYKATGSSVGWADAVYLIPWRYYLRYGEVRCRWEIREGGVEYEITIPSNTTAEIILPDGRKLNVHAGTWRYSTAAPLSHAQ